MKNLMSVLLVAVTLVPANLVPLKCGDVSARVNATISEQAALGKTVAFVDFYNLTWKELKAYRKAMQALGYKAEFTGGMGQNGINGALKIEW